MLKYLGRIGSNIFESLVNAPFWIESVRHNLLKICLSFSYYSQGSVVPRKYLKNHSKSLCNGGQCKNKRQSKLSYRPPHLILPHHHQHHHEVSGVRCQVSGVRCQMSGVRCQVSGVRCQVSGILPVRRARGAVPCSPPAARGSSPRLVILRSFYTSTSSSPYSPRSSACCCCLSSWARPGGRSSWPPLQEVWGPLQGDLLAGGQLQEAGGPGTSSSWPPPQWPWAGGSR